MLIVSFLLVILGSICMFVVAGDLLVPQILYVLGKLGFTCFSHSAHFFDWRWVDRRKLVPFRVLIFDLQYSLYIYIQM